MKRKKMATESKVGRPTGPKKRPLNVSLRTERINQVKEAAEVEGRTISEVVDRALDAKYPLA